MWRDINELMNESVAIRMAFLKANLPKLSELNTDSMFLMVDYDQFANDIRIGRTHHESLLPDLIDRMCSRGEINWKDINYFHVQYTIALKTLNSLEPKEIEQ